MIAGWFARLPVWAAALLVVGLLALAAAGGFALNEALRQYGRLPLSGPGAVKAWSKKVDRDPQDAPSRLGLAYALQASGQLDSALTEYDAVLRANPRDIAALYGRGDVLTRLNRPLEAESTLWEVLAQDGGHVRAAELLGEYYASKRQFRSLVKAVRPAVTAHPTEARLQYLMGLAYENLGNLDWAAARYRLALDVVPDMREALDGSRRVGR